MDQADQLPARHPGGQGEEVLQGEGGLPPLVEPEVVLGGPVALHRLEAGQGGGQGLEE